ncbi:hypothetical protein DWV13_13540 [Clostridium botulinum]|nr:hypothetical protein [Clostridium botulinum]MCS6132639.1 hypothetical protein [Clostridium botulinum]
MINNYKIYIKSKRSYLKRKKQLNREIRKLKKSFKIYKSYWGKRYRIRQIESRKDELYILRIMFNYNKYKNKH